jgi:fibronectin-binding autotransporter adhesin
VVSQSGTYLKTGGGGGVVVFTLEGNTGGKVGADGTGNINILGSGNITVAGNPGTNTEIISIVGVIPIANGGTNASSFSVTDGTVYYDGTRLVTTATGTAGQILTSNGAGVAPTYQAGAASSITITGDSGGSLTGNSFTFTGGTTGITFSGAGTTETLTGTLVVSNGGTGTTTLTSHGVLLGNTTSAITATAAGTTGQVLTGVTGSAPTFQSPAASSITITGDSGGGLTGSSFTFTGGTTGITFSGAGTTETLTGKLVVSNGGTGQATLTNHGVLVGAGTTAITQLAVGTTGQVLTGVTGADPVWASPAASSITITGDSGGGLTGNSFTFTGGTTGLTFSGAGTTETLIGTLVVSNGGTGRTTLTNHGLLVGAGTSAITQLADATNGQLPIGSTGADPVLATLTAGTGITITNGAGTISIAATGTSTLNFTSVTTTPYVVAATDDFLGVTTSSLAITVQLPNAPATGRVYTIKDSTGNAAAHNITVTTVGGTITIDGGTSYVMNTAYQSINVLFDGTNYEVF